MTTRARALAVVASFVTLFVVGSSTANAATPVSPDWPAPEPASTLDLLLLFGGSTVGLIVVITLFALLTARNNYVPPPPSTDVEKADTHH
ncbi:MAG TPA: hypothetical protein VNZ66_02765 [Aeromicrobium sp.]|nr:hypothetical protein [Aeromicrobium sp.]